MRSEGLERSNPKTGTVKPRNRNGFWGLTPIIARGLPLVLTALDGALGLAVTDFSYSETDRGFGRVGVSLRALPYGVLAKVGPTRPKPDHEHGHSDQNPQSSTSLKRTR